MSDRADFFFLKSGYFGQGGMDLVDGEMDEICLEALDRGWVEQGALGCLVGTTEGQT